MGGAFGLGAAAGDAFRLNTGVGNGIELSVAVGGSFELCAPVSGAPKLTTAVGVAGGTAANGTLMPSASAGSALDLRTAVDCALFACAPSVEVAVSSVGGSA